MCPYAARTHIVLEELGVDYQTHQVKGKPDWYLNINPRGKVPAIRCPGDDNLVVYESAICNEYLCDYFLGEDGGLMPSLPAQRAKLRLINDHYDSVVGPAQFTYLMNKDPAKDAELREALEKSLDYLEQTLASHSGPFFLGDAFTVADAHVAPFFLRLMVSLRHFKDGYEVPVERFPRLLQWHRNCAERPSVRAATPTDERIIDVYRKFVAVDYAFGGLNKNK